MTEIVATGFLTEADALREAKSRKTAQTDIFLHYRVKQDISGLWLVEEYVILGG